MRPIFTSKHTSLLLTLVFSISTPFSALFSQTFNGMGGMLVPPGAPGATVGITQSPCTVFGVGVLGGCVQVESVNISIDHTFVGDVGILLVAPNGAFIDLTTGNGGGADNWTNCTFTGSPASPFIVSGSAPYTGTWRPEGRATTLLNPYSNAAPLGTYTFLNTFNGINADGSWQLFVNDYVAVDWGTIIEWSITFSQGGTPPTAFPASLSACPNASGQATFNLTTLNSTINGNTSAGVLYYSDPLATIPIPNPAAYTTASTTIYAVVNNGVCTSDIVPVTLDVSPLTLTGTPTVTITPGTGCVPTPGTIVYDIGQPGVYVVSYTTVSSAGTINSTAATLPNGTWTWNVPFNSNYTITINSVGTPNTGCLFSTPPVSASFTATTPPTITLGGPNSICAGNNIDLASIVSSAAPLTFHSGIPATSANELPNSVVSPLASTIYYAFATFGAGCSNTVPVPINVSPSGTPNLGTITVCETSGNVNLITLQDPAFPGGSWSGPGVLGNQFSPSGQSGSVQLTYTPPGGCAQAASTDITVNPAATPTLGTTTLCSASGLFNLNSIGDPLFPNGVWSGPGVSGSNFNPASQSGNVIVTFTPTANCTTPQQTTIQVTSSIIPSVQPAAFCVNNGPFDLTTLEDPAFPGGTWSGPNVSGTFFNPTNPGTFTITYDAGASCTVPANTQILVSPELTPNLGTTSLCENSAPFNLLNITDPNFPNGVWSGSGVNGFFLDPSGLAGGVQLTYTPADPCTAPGTTNISISATGTPTLGTTTLCSNNNPINLNNTLGDPAFPTGAWSGPGVSGSFFNPSGQNGTVNLTFTPSAACATSAATTVQVDPVQVPNLQTASTCAGGGLFDLTTLLDPSLQNGTWSGPGVSGNSFNPATFSGFVSLTFTPSDLCTAPSNTTIDVQPLAVPALDPITLCESSGLFNLSLLADPSFPFGSWSGPGVSGNFFNPNGQTGPNVLTFTPIDPCTSPGSTTVTVEPSGTPSLGTDQICSSSGIYNLSTLEDPSFGAGVWSGQNVTNNQLNPSGLSGSITLSFNPNDPCANTASTTILVTASQAPNLGTATLCANAAPLNLNSLLDPTFNTGIWSGTGVTGNSFNPTGQNGPVTLTFTSNQACVVPTTTTVQVNPVNTPALSAATLCENSSPLNLSTLISSGPSTGTWSGVGVTSGFFDPGTTTGSNTLTFTPSAQCALPNTTSVQVNPALQYNSLEFDCQGTTTGYVVSFNITGGDPSQYLVNGAPVGQSYLSGVIPSASPFSFTVSDANGCGPLNIAGDFDCSCATFAGTMQITGPLTQLCQNQSFTAVFNQNQNLDPDDALVFVLHDNPGAVLGNVLATGATPTFTFPVGGVLNTTYYVSAIAGNTSGSGVQLTDPCLSVSQGVPVRWYQLNLTAQTSGSICASDCQTIQVQAAGSPPLRLIYSITGPTGTALDTVTLSTNNSTFDFCPGDYNLGVGVYTLQASSLSDPNCSLPLSQSIGSLNVVRPSATLNTTLCQGQTLSVGNQTFTQTNPTGVVVLPGASALGCDSTVQVNVSFTPSANASFQQQLCAGSAVTIGGQTFDAANPAGTVVLQNASLAGCDSIIQVNLSFVTATVGSVVQAICTNETVVVGGQTFSAGNPTGSVSLPGASYLGCDSIVNVSLTVRPAAVGQFNTQLCPGGSLTIGNQTFTQANPSGQVVFAGAAVGGCDSTLQVNVSFGSQVINNLTQVLCPGETITVGNETFNQSNPTGSVTFTNGSVLGCDSVVQVALTFLPPVTGQFSQLICASQTVTIGNQTFSAVNPSGTVILPGAAANGCDSTVQVNLTVGATAQSTIAQTLCPGETLSIGNQTFTQSNPSGTVTLVGGATSGCDSVVTVNLSYRAAAIANIQQQFCPGGSLTVGSQIFNQANPSGTVVLPGAAVGGCDSTVVVALTFGSAVINVLSPSLCPGETLVIGAQTFSQTNPSGSVTFTNGSVLGCDSIVQVSINYLAPAIGSVQQQLCTGGSLSIGNQVFNQANPNGTVLLAGAAAGGCDSTVVVALTFGSAVVNVLSPSLCPGETFAVGAQTFSQTNPSGSVTFTNGSVLGCDSIVQVSLNYLAPAIGSVQQQLCPGQSLSIGNQVFNQANPTGTVLLAGAGVGGCDSTVAVTLTFTSSPTLLVEQQLCPGGSLVVGGQTFNQANPGGTVTLPGAAVGGCDSIVQVSLTFGNAVVQQVTQTLCAGETYQVGNETFSQANPSGSVTFTNGSVFGCDSIVQVALTFAPEAVGNFETTICEGDTVLINGTAFHGGNRTGTTVLEAASVLGCDSTLTIAVNFYAPASSNLDTTLGLGQSFTFNGITYDAANPEGIVLLTSSNGCDSTVYVRVKTDKKYQVAVPNALATDGIVPFITLYGGSEIVEIELFQVFTRWGDEVFRRAGFQPNVPELGWDGRQRGKDLKPGVFVYQARVRFVDDTVQLFSGDVTVVR